MVSEEGEATELAGTSGNAEMGEGEDDDGVEDRKSAVRGLVGVVGLESWSTI